MQLESATVVVTGGTGFLGRHVVDELRHCGAKAVGVGSRDYDLRTRASIDRLLADTQPDALVHLAAVVGGIGANRAEPGRFFYENAFMGMEVLEACRTQVGKVLVAGTVCAYPKLAAIPFREDALWDGYPEETNAPYGLAKKMLLVQAQAFREQYGLNAVYLLTVNLYGPGDNFDLASGHVIPAMIRRFLEARDAGAPEVVLWGDGSPTREFIHVRDAARAFRMALELYDRPEPVNVGSGVEISISELAGKVAAAVGYTGAIRWDTTKPNGQPFRRLDVSRARSAFGFEASIDFAAGLAETIDGYDGQRQR
ncbi:MAG TPA: GDP-L-fucose synthase [Acidimicrobiales bacterium]|nr:GDP-L-fucose synthase [Acidimicrobiales bacterium]